MGRGRKHSTLKVRQRKGQRNKKQRIKMKIQEGKKKKS